MSWIRELVKQKMRQSDDAESHEEEARIGLMERKILGSSTVRQDAGSRAALSRTNMALILSNLFLAVLLILTNWNMIFARPSNAPSIESTAFVSHEPLPGTFKTIQFDDLLRYNVTSQTVWREMDVSLPRYFGKPSPEIDAAWAKLLRYEYPAVTPEEISLNPALSFTEQDRHPSTGQFYIALDVFHNLHCLNAVRKQLDSDHYGAHRHGSVSREAADGSSAVDDAQRDHIDHCMNHIRQSLQCRPDLTPAAMNVYTDRDGSKFFLGNADTHSCYDWDQFMQWAEQRRSSPDSYVEIDG